MISLPFDSVVARNICSISLLFFVSWMADEACHSSLKMIVRLRLVNALIKTPMLSLLSGCVGRGPDLDLRIRPATAASRNPGYTDLAPLGLRSKNKVF